MTAAADRALLRLAARQAGVLGLAQALESGLSRSGVARRLRSREWVCVQPRAYRLRALPPDRAAPMWAAVLSVPRAVVSARSAAWWHGMLDLPPAAPEIVVPPGSHGLALRDVRVVSSTLDPLDVTVRRGLRLVARPLAVLQSTTLLPTGGAALMDRALQQWVTWSELSAAADRFRGRRGATGVATLLRAAADGAESEAERLAHTTLRAAGIAGWRPNHQVGRYRIDIAFPDARLAVEIDGWAWHHDPDRFQRDRTRQNQLSLAGWQVLRFTWADLQDPADFVRQIARALGRQEPAGIGR